MPFRTETKYRTIFSRTGREAVVYDLSEADRAVITVPPSSRWTSGPHWHETHAEYLRVTKGKAQITLGKSTWIHEADNGVITIPRGMIHEWRRSTDLADLEDLVVVEWTEPADGQKEVFFRMLNSFLTEPDPTKMHEFNAHPLLTSWLEQYVIVMQLFLIFAACDNWPVFFGLRGSFGWAVTHLVLSISNAFACLLLKLEPVYNEYVRGELQLKALNREKSLSDRTKS